ncbi:hypothetical protein CVO96_20095 [Deinococcus koreensis]|uniref:Uncharacterized protein n=1 Tax=Deinococcus koreensis TaxID=2054903 RepID=A0A2K3URU3_9DEIO|nr:hypothetical protein CVO96_20095 [Deinococcus koreensis]
MVIPDPDDGDYLSTFMAIQRKHPRLAAKLVEAEQADPADLLPPPSPRAPHQTWRHRMNRVTERLLMRRGLDGHLVWDRNRVLRSGLMAAGVLMGGVLIYSVTAPKPRTVVASSTTTTTEQNSGGPEDSTPAGQADRTDTSGAFPDGAPNPNKASDPATQAKLDTLDAEGATGTFTPEETPIDEPPQPVTASTSATPPPPAVFREVDVPQEPAPVTALPDAAPVPVAISSPSASAPFGGEDSAPPVQPFAVADTPEPAPAPAKPVALETVDPPPMTSSSLFGGEASAPAQGRPSPATMATAAPEVTPPERGQALIYQKPAETKATEQQSPPPQSALLYQASTKEGGDSSAPRSAMVYQASAQGSSGVDTGNSLTDQQEQSGVTTASARGGAIMYQRRATPRVPAGAPANTTGGAEFGNVPATPDPDAPKFSPTSQIPAKTLTAIRTAAGVAVPVVVVSSEGNWIGTASYNPALGRVDMTFGRFVHMKSGKTYPVQALGYQAAGGNLAQGVAASVRPMAPTLGLDLARAGLNSLNVYTQALSAAGTTTTNGTVTTVNRQAPAFAQVLQGELGKLAQLPEGHETITVVADVATNTDVIILFGVGPAAGAP